MNNAPKSRYRRARKSRDENDVYFRRATLGVRTVAMLSQQRCRVKEFPYCRPPVPRATAAFTAVLLITRVLLTNNI